MHDTSPKAQNNSVNFGLVNKFIFLGGGQSLFDGVRHLLSQACTVTVITSDRHYHSHVCFEDEMVPLYDALASIGIECHLVSQFDINSNLMADFDSNSLALTPSAEWIFKQDDIDKLGGRLVNLHGTRLPDMKGGGGLSWNLMMGVKEGGATIHLVDSGIDAGDILLQTKYKLPDDINTLEEATRFAQTQNSDLIVSFLDKVIANETFERKPQDINSGTYWPRLKTDIHGFINWNWSAKDISLFVSAFGSPYKGVSTFLSDKRVRFLNASVVSAKDRFHPFQYGLVFRTTDEGAYIACKDGALVVDYICDEQGEEIDKKKLLGRRFHTPSSYLEAALRKRVVSAHVSEFDEYRTKL